MTDHTPLSPTFREPVPAPMPTVRMPDGQPVPMPTVKTPPGVQPVPMPAVQLPIEGAHTKTMIPVPGTQEYAEALQAAVDRHPAGSALQRTEPAPRVTAGPAPVLEGSFAIFVTPDESLVVAYRPRGAVEDKHFVVPAFLVSMATQKTGHTIHDIVAGLQEGL